MNPLWRVMSVAGCLFLAACQKVELPVKEGETPPDTGAAVPGGGEDHPAVLPGEFSERWTVDGVKEAYAAVNTDDRIPCSVTGYIVGYLKTSAMAGAVFSAEGAVESNLILADSPDETEPARCLPVQLLSGSGVRSALNLAAHPDVWGRRVCIGGYASRYCGTVGLRQPKAYVWVEAEPGVPGEEPSEPVPAPGTETEKKDTLEVDDTPVPVPGGRSIPSGRKEGI